MPDEQVTADEKRSCALLRSLFLDDAGCFDSPCIVNLLNHQKGELSNNWLLGSVLRARGNATDREERWAGLGQTFFLHACSLLCGCVLAACPCVSAARRLLVLCGCVVGAVKGCVDVCTSASHLVENVFGLAVCSSRGEAGLQRVFDKVGRVVVPQQRHLSSCCWACDREEERAERAISDWEADCW